MKRIISILLTLVILACMFSSCRPSDKVSNNISKEADNFNVTRKITIVNMRTDKIMFEITGTFSLQNNSTRELAIVCLAGIDENYEKIYKKHYVYLNDWTSYVMEDISGASVDPYHYEIVIYPQLPNIEIQG